MANNFVNWLLSMLEIRDWSQAELARRSGLTTAAISRVLSEERNPGTEFCNAVADALKIPPEEVFRQAGILPPDSDPKTIAEKVAVYKLDELTETQVDEVIQFIEFIQDRDERTRRAKFLERHTREGTHPPDFS